MVKTYGPSLDIEVNAAVLGGSITFLSIMRYTVYSAACWDANLNPFPPSAIRGDISYICYSFLFFMLGFAASIGIKIPLTWFSRGPNTPIRNPHIWEGLILLFGAGGATSVTVAFIFLAACIHTMNRDPGVPAKETFSPLGAVYTGYAV